MSSLKNKTQVITDETRLSYLHAFKPWANQPGQEEKYSACVIIPKTAKKTIAFINEAIENATENGKTSKWSGKVPKNLHNPLRDGDEVADEKPELKGCWYLNANSTRRPGLINADRSEIFSEEDLKSGDYAKVHLSFYPYAASGNNGIAVGLENIMKTRDGEALGGARMKAEDAFDGEWEDEDGLLD